MIKVKQLVGNEFSFLEPYHNSHKPILCRHNKCGLEFKVKPYYFFNKHYCPLCTEGAKINSDVIEFMLKKHGYILLNHSESLNSHSILIIKHRYCGYVRKIKAIFFLKSPQCRRCNLTHDLQDYLDSETNHSYKLLSNYIKTDNKVKVIHKKCGHIYQTMPHSIKKGNGRCPYCSARKFKYIMRSKRGLSDSQFKSRVKKMVSDDYTFIDKYVNASTKLRCKHNKCGFVFKVCPRDFYKGSGCPKCKSSKGERFIKSYLDLLKCPYKQEFTFSSLKDKNELRFDFYLPTLNICIEYDGIQHYKPQEWMGGSEKFAKQRKHDIMKDTFCHQHNIRLIRISYEYNTYEKVRERLDKLL